MNSNLNRNSVDDLCDSVAQLRLKPADAALIYYALCDYRAKNAHTHIALMRVPGLARLWACLETTCALAAARDNPMSCDPEAASVKQRTGGVVGGKQ
jgi:hypothetical protein